jgi:hypothetical protein
MYTIDNKNIVQGTTSIAVNYKGNTVTGELMLRNNSVEYGAFKVGSYDLTYNNGTAYVAGLSNKTTAYADGTAVYFNPNTGEKCTESQYTSNNGSTTNKKEGCMRWYTFGDKENDTTIKMILDHNTSNRAAAWVSKDDFIKAGGTEEEYDQKDSNNYVMGNNSKGPITVTNKLKDDTKQWQQETAPRLITANEIAAITNKADFDSKTSIGWGYWFKGNDQKIGAGTGPYAWLYGYLSGCENYGCNKQDQSSSWAYWTIDRYAGSSSSAWFVHRNGRLSRDYVSYTDLGVRPVITISKSKLA